MKALVGPQYYQASVDQAHSKAKTAQYATAALDRTFTVADAVRVEEIAKLNPSMSPELMASIALAKMPPEETVTPTFAEIMKRDAAANEWNWFGIKPAMRGTFLSMEALWQSAQRNQRLLVNLARGQNPIQAWQGAGTTYLDELVSQAAGGNPINIGSGFIPRSDVAANYPEFVDHMKFYTSQQGLTTGQAMERTALDMERKYGAPLTSIVDEINETSAPLYFTLDDGTVASTPYSLGRFISGQFVAPETRPFELISGSIDGFNRIFGDPIDVPITEAVLWRQSLGRLVPPQASGDLRNAWDEYLMRHNIIADGDVHNLDSVSPRTGKPRLGAAYREGQDAGLSDELVEQLGDPDTPPIVLWRDKITEWVNDLDNHDPASTPHSSTRELPGGEVVPRTFENEHSLFGGNVEDLPEWQRGKLESPHAQAYADMDVTVNELRETIYLRGGKQTAEDFVLEHELIHTELQNAKRAESARAWDDMHNANLSDEARKQAQLDHQRLQYEIEYEATQTAFQRLKNGELSADGLRQEAYREAGISKSWRPWVKTNSVDDWLQSERGQRIISFLTDTKSMNDVDQILPNLPASVKANLVDADDPAKVIDELYNYAGGPRMQRAPTLSRSQRIAPYKRFSNGLETKAGDAAGWLSKQRTYSPVAQAVRRWVAESGDMVLDPHNIDDSMRSAKNWLFTVGASVDEVDDVMYALAKADGNMGAMGEVWDGMIGVFERRLGALGYDTHDVGLIMEDFYQQNMIARLYFDNLAGSNQLLYKQGRIEMRDGVQLQMLSGHLSTEMSHNFIVMPNLRDVRRATNTIRARLHPIRKYYPESWFNKTEFRDPLGMNPNFLAMLLDPAMSLWRNSALLRVGWPLRVIPEELIRQQAAGYTEAIRHPFSYLALVFSSKKGGAALAGDSLTTAFNAKALGAGAFDVTWQNAVRGTPFDAHNTSWAIARIGDQHYNVGLAREILDIYKAPIARMVAEHNKVDDVLDYLRDIPAGRQMLDEIVEEAAPGSVWKLTKPGKGNPAREADRTLKSVLQSIEARIQKNTGGHYHAREIDPSTGLPTGRWIDDYNQPIPMEQYDDMTRADRYAEIKERGLVGYSRATTDELKETLLRDDGYGHIVDAADDDFFITTKVGDGQARHVMAHGTTKPIEVSDEAAAISVQYSEKVKELDAKAREWAKSVTDNAEDQVYLMNRVKRFDENDGLLESVGYSKGNGRLTEMEIPDEIQRLMDEVEELRPAAEELGSSMPQTGVGGQAARRLLYDEMDVGQMRDFEDAVEGAFSDPSFLPESVKVPDQQKSRNLSPERYDQLTDGLFSGLMAVPSRKLVRSPFARLRYNDEAARAYIFSTDSTRQEILNFIDDNDMRALFDESVARQLDEMNLTGLPTAVEDGFQSFDDFDRVVKALVVNETKELFYDLAKRQNWADMSRLLFPFADAWWEVLSRWAKFLDPTGLVPGRQSGQQLAALRTSRKAEVLVNGLRTNGYFSEDKYGNEVFNWPGFGLLAGNEGGVGLSAQTDLQNLMFIDPTVRGFIGPSTGPMAQVLGSYVVPKLPAYMRGVANEAIYGSYDPSHIENPWDIAATFIPTWMRRLVEAGMASYRQVNADTIIGLYSSTYLSNNPYWGDGSAVSSRERLEWAQEQGSQLAWLRILDGIFSPSQPRYEPTIWMESMATGDPRWVQQQALADEFRAAREYYQNDIAAEMYMIETFGIDPLDLLPATRATVDRPATENAYTWLTEHDFLYADAKYSLMAWVPADETDAFSWQAYQEQFFIETDLGFVPRQKLTGPIVAQMHSELKGYRAWDWVKTQYDEQLTEAKAKMAPAALKQYRADLDAWKNDQRNQISNRFWGWGREVAGKVASPTYQATFDEMTTLARMPHMQVLNPQLADWIGFTTELWNDAVNMSLSKGYGEDWWRTSEGGTGEAAAIRDWFMEGLDRKRAELTDSTAVNGAAWYSQRVIAPLLNGAMFDDQMWFEAEPPPVMGEQGVYSADQLNRLGELPGNQTPVMPQYAEQGVMP